MTTTATVEQIGKVALSLAPIIEKAINLAEKYIPEPGQGYRKELQVLHIMQDIVENSGSIKVKYEEVEPLLKETIAFIVLVKNAFNLWRSKVSVRTVKGK
jgi:hypothetical protein